MSKTTEKNVKMLKNGEKKSKLSRIRHKGPKTWKKLPKTSKNRKKPSQLSKNS